MAITPVLFSRADKTTPSQKTTMIICFSVFATFRAAFATFSVTPVSNRAPPTRIMEISRMTVELEKPAMASAGVTIPVRTRTARQSIAVRGTGIFSEINRTAAATSTISVITAGEII